MAQYLALHVRVYNNSDIPTEDYHAIADATMDSLLDSLEALVDAADDPSYEVEYSVGQKTSFFASLTMLLMAEWCIDSQARRPWRLCDQQATSKQADMAEQSGQRSKAVRLG